MATRLDDVPSTTGYQIGTPRIARPFLNYPTPDKYARIIERDWAVIPANFVTSVANRTSYTNYLTYSEQFDNAAWTATNVTVTADQLANPGDGQVTADCVVETTTNGEHRVAQAYTFTAVAHAFSVFVKANGRNYVRLRANDGSTDFTAFFNLSTGATGTVGAGVTASILALSDSWYRCRITFTPAAASGNLYINTSSDGSTISYTGSTSAGVYLFGAQLERASSAGPYISTTSASRTISAPDADPGDTVNAADPFAFLVEEVTPLTINAVARASYQRRWARVPKQQVVPSSLLITKPSLSAGTQTVGDYRVFQPDSTVQKFDAYERKTITSDSGAPAGVYPTGGTYTLGYGATNTAAQAYNANAATIQTALNAITAISNRGGCTVSGSYNTAGGFAVTFATYANVTWTLSGSLTPAYTPVSYRFTVASSNGGYSQSCTFSISDPDNYFIGGSFQINVGANTTASIPYNASPGTAQAAFNAIASVIARGGCTISVPSGQSTVLAADSKTINFTITFSPASLITGDASSLTPSPSAITATALEAGSNRIQSVVFASPGERTLYVAAGHGLSLSDTIMIRNGSADYPGISGVFTLPDAYTVVLTINPTDAYVAAATLTELGRRTKQNYVPGVAHVRAKRVTDYYLPGVSVGITTADDITMPTPQSDSSALLLAIFAGAGTINWAVGQVEPWIGPILSVGKTTINAADVV